MIATHLILMVALLLVHWSLIHFVLIQELIPVLFVGMGLLMVLNNVMTPI